MNQSLILLGRHRSSYYVTREEIKHRWKTTTSPHRSRSPLILSTHFSLDLVA